MEEDLSNQNELGLLFSKVLPSIKKNKFKFISIYIVFILYFSIPTFQIPILEYNHFRITSLMEQRAIENFLFFYPKQSWVGFNDVSPNLFKAIISMEDGNFFNHKGVDWKEFDKSLKTNRRKNKKARGGSTITMQLSKNLFFTTNKSIFRKAKEILVTFRMEKEISKNAILLNYVNAVEWGDGIFGIKKAADIFFKKDADALNTSECSQLAAVIPAPLKFQPNKNSKYVNRRSSIIKGRLFDVNLSPSK